MIYATDYNGFGSGPHATTMRKDAPEWTPNTMSDFGMEQNFMPPQDGYDDYWGEFTNEFFEDVPVQAPDGSFVDVTGAWHPPAPESLEGYYDDTGAWIPPGQKDSKPQVSDAALKAQFAKVQQSLKNAKKSPQEKEQEKAEALAREAEAKKMEAKEHADAVMARKKLETAVKEVVPEKAKDPWVPNNMCWNFLRGSCERGFACPWRHTVNGQAETEDEAHLRREIILAKLNDKNVPKNAQQRLPAAGYPEKAQQRLPNWNPAGDPGRPWEREAVQQIHKPVRNCEAKQSFDQMFDSPKARDPFEQSFNSFGGIFDTPPKPQDRSHCLPKYAQDGNQEIAAPLKHEHLFGCTVEAETGRGADWQPPSWAAVVKTPPGFKTLRGAV